MTNSILGAFEKRRRNGWQFVQVAPDQGEWPMLRRSHLPPITLGIEEYQQLRRWSRSPRRVGRALALRARIILQCRHGRSNRQVAQSLGVPEQTVCKWRQRFLAERPSAYSPASG